MANTAMSTMGRLTVAFVLLSAILARGQAGVEPRSSSSPEILSCSPAPCVLPAVQGAAQGAYDAAVTANPANPRDLILGSDYTCPDRTASGFNLSTDGGSSWNDLVCMFRVFYKGQEYDPIGGPILGYDLRGTAYIGGFYMNGSGESAFGFEGVEKKSPGDKTWSAPAAAVIRQNYFPDNCWLAVDTSISSPYVDSVYVSCITIGPLGNNSRNQVVVSHSNDGGLTWHQVPVAPTQNYPDGDAYTSATVGSNGAVYVTWLYCNTGPYFCNNNEGYMLLSKSVDGGNTWSTPVVATAVMLHGVPNTDLGVENLPAISVDHSDGPNSGNLYVVMYNWTGTFMQVQVVRSTDGGNTWSQPVPVAPGITHDQFSPWISVSPAGLVGVSWLDRRNDPANTDYQAFAAISSDGGLTFQPSVALIKKFSDPNNDPNGGLGGYTGNTWDGPNYFVAAWMDNSDGGPLHDEVGGIRLK